MSVRLIHDGLCTMKTEKEKTFSTQGKYTIHIPSQRSQLTSHRLLLPNNPHLRPTVAQTNLPTLHTRHKPHTLPSFRILLPSPPNLRNKTVTGLDRRREPRREFSQIRRIATTQQLQQPVGRGVPRVQAVQNRAAETHRLARLGSRVQRVVIAVQTIQVRRLQCGLVLVHSIRLFALRRRVVLALRTLRTSPSTLANEERRASDLSIQIPIRGINEVHLSLHDSAGLALVVDAEDFLAQLERAAFGRRGDGLEEGHGSLAVNYALGVELGHSRDAGIASGLRGVEVDYFLRGFLEGENNGVGWECGEVRVEFLTRAVSLHIMVVVLGASSYIEEV